MWLEAQFNRIKVRGAIRRPLRYVRKRSFKRVRAAEAVRFEELAKVRFAFYDEPTRCIADPRSLWTSEEDGGFYERSFGIDGKLEDSWDDKEFRSTLFATVVFLRIMENIGRLVKSEKSKYAFLRRLRYWALNLAALHVRHRKLDMEALLDSSTQFDTWFEGFWRDIFRDLVAAHRSAQADKISNFALARNETRWTQTRDTVELVLNANL